MGFISLINIFEMTWFDVLEAIPLTQAIPLMPFLEASDIAGPCMSWRGCINCRCRLKDKDHHPAFQVTCLTKRVSTAENITPG